MNIPTSPVRSGLLFSSLAAAMATGCYGMVGALPNQCSTEDDCPGDPSPMSDSSAPAGSGATAVSGGSGMAAQDPVYRIKSTYSEGSTPFYLADCVQAGTLARLNETDHITANDFLFHIKPGLANPDDPGLVSFESVSNPGSYLRIDSANLTSATRAITTGAYSWDTDSSYDHLTWLDAFTDTPAFRTDATFTMTAALNGDATMVSLQWYNDNARYLRHDHYHVFALAPATDQEKIDSSFVFEVQPANR